MLSSLKRSEVVLAASNTANKCTLFSKSCFASSGNFNLVRFYFVQFSLSELSPN